METLHISFTLMYSYLKKLINKSILSTLKLLTQGNFQSEMKSKQNIDVMYSVYFFPVFLSD